ncbi:MAG: hypothetical protein HZA36_01065 [Parcubacteria group bacterium]|nr:hypothetical protein [Parcubacteria group bacterium]
MPDDQKPFHLSLDTPTTPAGDSPQAPQPTVQSTTSPSSTVAPTPAPQAAPIQQTPAPSPQPVVPINEPIKNEQPTPPVNQPIRPPVMPTQGAAPRTPRTVALPMAPHVVIHTMESDIQDAKKALSQIIPPTTVPNIEKSDFHGNEPQSLGSRTSQKVEPPSKSKLLIGIILILVVLSAAGYFGYDTITPIFVNKMTLPIPQSSEQEKAASLTQEETPPTPTTQQSSHASLLKKPADKTISSNIESLTFQDIKKIYASLVNEQAGTLEEIIPSFNTTSIALKNFGALFLVSFPFNLFEDDFTLLAYHDAKGVWSVVILKLKPNTENQNIALTKADIQRIVEQDSQISITQLFAEDPGAPTSNFINGGVPNSQAEVRYRTFENGNVLNYGWLDDKLIISTSYAGLKEVIVRLQ